MAVNILASYEFHSEADLSDIRRKLVCGKILIDSGAFSAHTSGRLINLDDYANYLTTWRECWDHAVTLDVIGDPNATRRNTHTLHQRGLPVMPVFTRGDTLANFDAMVRDHQYVCLGGLVGLPAEKQVQRAAMLQRRARNNGGGVHALGVGSLSRIQQIRPYSADSSAISGSFRYGSVSYWTGTGVRTTAITDRKRLARDWRHIRDHGIPLGHLDRIRKMPATAEEGRRELLAAMSAAYAVADETLTTNHPIPLGRDAPGPHLYNAVANSNDLHGAANLDRILHSDQAPPIWGRHQHTHQCHPTPTGTQP